MAITPNQKSILEKLAGSSVPLHGRDFAGIATVQHGRWEWANPILKGLLAKGLVARGTQKSTKGFSWSITDAGREAISGYEPAQAVPPTASALSDGMKTEIVWIGNCETRGEEVEAFGRRMTHVALERRGLLVITSEDRGWRTLALTPSGKDLFKVLTPKTQGRP